ncbi:MAG TPA: antibiotic biosynthesis monooxygenase [Terriglobales bacterium]|jgi:heme-degrading monooxygenase HmoA
MEKVLIDTFVVPEESKAAFLDGARQTQSFVRTLPGFVEGFLYEKHDGEGRINFLTIAVWKDEEAFENAKKAAAAEFQRRGFNPQERLKALKVERARSTYERTPY